MIKSRKHMQNFCLLSLRHLTTSALSDKKSDSADARCTTPFSFAMKFVNPHTGADVADHDVGTHLYRRVRFDDNKLRDLCFAAQPGADWETITGVRTIAYSDAMVWAAAAAFGGPNLTNLRGATLWNLRPSPAKMEATLALAAGAMPTIIKAGDDLIQEAFALQVRCAPPLTRVLCV